MHGSRPVRVRWARGDRRRTDGEVVVALATRVAMLVGLLLRALVLVRIRFLDLSPRHAVCHRQISIDPRRAPITPGLISLICESSFTR